MLVVVECDGRLCVWGGMYGVVLYVVVVVIVVVLLWEIVVGG